MVWYSYLLKNFPQFIVIHTVKVFGIVNKAEIDVFLELSCFLHDPADVSNLISGSSAFSKTSLPPTSNAEEAEWFYEELQDLLEPTPQKDVLFIIGDWNAKAGCQETPGVTGKFGLGARNEAGQRLIESCQKKALVIANMLLK